MIKTIIGVLLIIWLLGFIGKVGGELVHLLLVVALIVFIYDRMVSKKNI